MSTIKLNLNIEAFDCYIYSGHLFIFLKDGSIGCLNLNSVYHTLYLEYPEFVNFFRLIFQRNDYFQNKQGIDFFGIPEIKNSFLKTWSKIAKNIEFDYNDFRGLNILAKIPEKDLPILDVKIYGMKIFVGTINGVYSLDLSLNKNNEITAEKNIHKKFDARTVYLNAKSGSLAISTNNDGLFYGSIYGSNGLSVNEKEVSNKSIRTSWVNYDLINYSNNVDFEYLENTIEKTVEESSFSYRDEKVDKRFISGFGENKINSKKLMQGLNFHDENIKYAFNSSQSVFLITDKGNFYNSNIQFGKSFDNLLEDLKIESNPKYEQKKVWLSSRCVPLPKVKNKKILKPLSSHIIEKGCVLEFLDKIILFRKNKAEIIDRDPTINIRSYPASLRYKNLVTITKTDKITIHSINPF